MFDSPLSESAYAVLRVDPAADEQALRRAYRQRLRETHPDTGGDPTLFGQVQRAWELVGTPQARAGYDRDSARPFAAPPQTRTDSGQARDTMQARGYGHPGGLRREQYLTLIREWAGRGADLGDPYRPAVVRSAPSEIRHLLADALAEEDTARRVADLGIGYTVWHDVAAPSRADPRAKVDHVVLGPSGLYALASEDFGCPVRIRRGELLGAGVTGTPIGTLVAGMRVVARAARVRFSGAILVLPDDDFAATIEEVGSVRGRPVAVCSRSGLSAVLRRGITGVRPIGGNELFDMRTRLQQAIQFV